MSQAMHNPKLLPFHIKPLEDNACVVITKHNNLRAKDNSELDFDIRYSFDNKTYKKYEEPIEVKKGQIIYFKGNNKTLGNIDTNNNYSKDTYFTNFSCEDCYSGSNKKYNVYGNITSLIDPDNYNVPIPAACFRCFFLSQKIIDASELYLPSKVVGCYAYESMFEHCNYMKYSPKDLPAEHVPKQAYSRMFKDCVALKSVPNIYATRFNRLSFREMFNMHDKSYLKLITNESNPVHFSRSNSSIFQYNLLYVSVNEFTRLIWEKNKRTILPDIQIKCDL